MSCREMQPQHSNKIVHSHNNTHEDDDGHCKRLKNQCSYRLYSNINNDNDVVLYSLYVSEVGNSHFTLIFYFLYIYIV